MDQGGKMRLHKEETKSVKTERYTRILSVTESIQLDTTHTLPVKLLNGFGDFEIGGKIIRTLGSMQLTLCMTDRLIKIEIFKQTNPTTNYDRSETTG
jgi:hypothetical protein